ncbi:MAG: neutral/alkaline non-lysosomal ceramidase N-terminal domain-containing protein, partial [Planctomycetota bacterium]
MHRFAVSFFAFAFLTLATAGSGNAQEIEVGFAKTSLVTNQSGVPLGGYGGRGLIPLHAVHDPVYVKAMVVKNGDQAVAMVTFDLIGVQRTILEALEKRGFPEHVKLNASSDLLLSASHTHAGYGGLAKSTGAWYLDGLFFVTCGPYQPEFFDEVLTKVHKTIVAAWDDLAPARIGIASEEIDGLSRNRGRGGDVTDKELGVIKVTDPKGKLRGLLINFTAHPTILGVENLRLSGGYPGALLRILQERYEGSTVLFTNGAEGD